MKANNIQAGHEVTGPQKYVTSYRTWLFSGGWPRFDGWPAKNVHTDPEFALACGLPARGASAATVIAYLSEMMVDLFGEEWLSTGRIELKFLKLIEIDDRIVARGTVTALHDDGSADMELWCENQRGEKVCAGVGRASAVVPAETGTHSPNPGLRPAPE